MGYYVIIGDKFERPLASLEGWRQFKKFLNTFRDQDLHTVKHLVDHGMSENLPRFLGELLEMLKHHPDEGVTEIINDLIQTIQDAPREFDCIFLTDGVLKEDAETDPDDSLWFSFNENGMEITTTGKPTAKKTATKKTPVKKAAAKPAKKATKKKR